MDWNMQIARWVHEGKVWRVNATDLDPAVTAVPTVAGGTSLYNGEREGRKGKSYLLLAVYGIQGGSPGALSSWGLVDVLSSLAQGTTEPAAGALLDTDDVVKNLQGGVGKYGGAAVIDIAETVIDDRWAPIGNSIDTVVISLTGSQIYKALDVPVEIPPKAMYTLQGVASATDVTVRHGFVWVELTQAELDAIGRE